MPIQVNTHINNWIDKADPDYYTMFIKAWIPYNAWYMNNFYDEDNNRTSDKTIINYIKNNSNKYRDKIISILNNTTEVSQSFFKYLSKLHYELELHPIPNFENRLSFQTTSIEDNISRSSSNVISAYTYTANFDHALPKTAKRWICEVIETTTARTIHRIELFKWSISELEEDSIFRSISDRTIASNIKTTFNEINPKKPTNIVVTPNVTSSGSARKPNNSITIDADKNLYFIDDKSIVSKVIVQLIYELRCKLFHGELDPTSANQGIYEHAYHIQRILIKELR